MSDPRHTDRIRVLESCGATPDIIDELLAYGDQPCRAAAGQPPLAFPLPDEPQVEAWLGYEREARAIGAVEALKQHLVQLRFPVRAGMSEEDGYRRATRKGDVSAADDFAPGLVINRPDAIDLTILPSIAGRLSLIVSGDRADFETLVQALTARNEPDPVPAAMGACMVKGLNNWSRIAAYREQWVRTRPDTADTGWPEEFSRLIQQKPLYQDRLIILSTGPYSATPAAATGLPEREWLDRSLVIRREHELTHYFVYRVFGIMRTHMFDEIVADFIGLGRAFGEYRADLALRFLGLEDFPAVRPGGRIEVYRPNPRLSDDADASVRTLTHRGIINLQALSAGWPREWWDDLGEVASLTFALSQLTLEELASPHLAGLVASKRP